MPTAKDVADWMFEQFQKTRWLYQEVVVYEIKKRFGQEFVSQNANGNDSISKDVLKHFRSLTEGKAVWDRHERAWRHLSKGEVYQGRQVD